MFGFLFRKTIFDGWDHILGLFLANIGYLLLLALGFQFWSLCSKGILPLHVTALLLVLVILLFSLYSMGIARYASNIAGGARRGQGLEGVPETVRTHVPHAMLFAFITLVIVVNLLFAMPFYMSMGGFTGPMMAFVGLFLALFLAANFQYYLPLCMIRREESVVEIIKYSFAYALDNKGITAVLMLRSLMDLQHPRIKDSEGHVAYPVFTDWFGFLKFDRKHEMQVQALKFRQLKRLLNQVDMLVLNPGSFGLQLDAEKIDRINKENKSLKVVK